MTPLREHDAPDPAGRRQAAPRGLAVVFIGHGVCANNGTYVLYLVIELTDALG